MPRRPIELHPDAVTEGREARAWYEARNPAAAEAFLAELDRAIDQISEHPERWGAYLHGTRRFLLRRFPYIVVYRETESVTQVVAIAHGRRRPGYWQTRQEDIADDE